LFNWYKGVDYNILEIVPLSQKPTIQKDGQGQEDFGHLVLNDLKQARKVKYYIFEIVIL
jgi:hypothetical protein